MADSVMRPTITRKGQNGSGTGRNTCLSHTVQGGDPNAKNKDSPQKRFCDPFRRYATGRCREAADGLNIDKVADKEGGAEEIGGDWIDFGWSHVASSLQSSRWSKREGSQICTSVLVSPSVAEGHCQALRSSSGTLSFLQSKAGMKHSHLWLCMPNCLKAVRGQLSAQLMNTYEIDVGAHRRMMGWMVRHCSLDTEKFPSFGRRVKSRHTCAS